jgi:hypothetical protein
VDGREEHSLKHLEALKELGCLAVILAPVALLVRNAARVGFSCAAFVNVYDVRLVNYFLEWGYSFLFGKTNWGATIWSPPFYYPESNVLAYSETFFSAYPFYIPARSLGASPEAALFWFVIAQYCLTPLVSYLCARRVGMGRLASLVFATCFSWSWIRYYQAAHLQFAAGWIIPLFLTCVYEFSDDARLRWIVGAAWTLAFAWFMSLYIAYFLVLIAVLVATFAILRGGRAALPFQFHRARWWRTFIVIALLAIPIVAMAVGAYHYKLAGAVVGDKNLDEALTYQASLWSWIRADTSNLLWRHFSTVVPADTVAAQEKQLFLGWIALACSTVFIVRGRAFGDHRRLTWRVLWACSVCVPAAILLVSHFPNPLSPLNRVYLLAFKVLPGFGALRASGRIALVVSALSCLLTAVLLEKLGQRRPVLGLLLAAMLVAEALPPVPPLADRCEADRPWQALKPALCASARAHQAATLFFIPTEEISLNRIFDQVPEMTIALECGLNTINGYTGKAAPLVAPLFRADPSQFACTAARTALLAAMRASGRGVLIYVEREGPLGAPVYTADDVAQCFEPCLVAREPVVVAGRIGEAIAIAPGSHCGGAP